MTILVTGKQGQLASALADLSQGNELTVRCAGRSELDLTDVETIRRVIEADKPSTVINAAAYTDVEKAEGDRERAIEINATGAGLLAKVCAELEIPIIQISSDYVFNGQKNSPYVETDKTSPINQYGWSKLCGEKNVIAANFRHIIVRTSWVFSPTGKNFVRTMLDLARSKPGVFVVDDQFGCPTYARDLARALLDICEIVSNTKPESPVWGTYHVAGNGVTSWYELAKAVFAQSQLSGGPVASVNRIKSHERPTIAQRPPRSILDCRKAENSFNISLPSWQSGVSRCVARILGDKV